MSKQTRTAGAGLWRRSALAVTVGALLFTSGCAVSPKPLTLAENSERAEQDLKALFADQEPVNGPVTLYEAMARAIKYNLDHRLKAMEQALSQQQLDLANIEMMPKVMANAGYHDRDKVLASSSEDVRTGATSLATSTSQEQVRRTSDLTFTWNILDFGVSYIRAQQEADRALIAEERRRKVIHNIIQDVRSAYWRAVSAERLLARIDPLLERVAAALEDSRRIETRKLRRPMDALTYQRTLLDTLRQLQTLRRELVVAKTQLAAMMNVAPGSDFELAAPADWFKPVVPMSVAELEEMALIKRPELREETYQTRISAKETRKAILEMLPGISLYNGWNYDSNDYLYHNHWRESGARISWNLMNLFSAPQRLDVAGALKDVTRTRRLALSMAVLTQVHVAYQRLAEAREEFRINDELSGVEERIFDQLEAERRTARTGELEAIRGALNAVIGQLRRDMAYAEMQNAAGRLLVSVGLDPLPETIPADDVDTLATAIKRHMSGWFQG